ncbi:MAG: hypothetical protein HUU41_06890 [Bryobacteraceae bacterium]|nr:hypothetical protein [Bryobacterales bacterium]NUN00823.1 hypothetical protein [Bryobacteraceae bacterium]
MAGDWSGTEDALKQAHERSQGGGSDTSTLVVPAAGIARLGNSGAFIPQGPGLSVFHLA